MKRRFFSAKQHVGAKSSIVGVGVAGCPGAAWLFCTHKRQLAFSLLLATPKDKVLPGWFKKRLERLGIKIRDRNWRGRTYYHAFGPADKLRQAAGLWSAHFYPSSITFQKAA